MGTLDQNWSCCLEARGDDPQPLFRLLQPTRWSQRLTYDTPISAASTADRDRGRGENRRGCSLAQLILNRRDAGAGSRDAVTECQPRITTPATGSDRRGRGPGGDHGRLYADPLRRPGAGGAAPPGCEHRGGHPPRHARVPGENPAAAEAGPRSLRAGIRACVTKSARGRAPLSRVRLVRRECVAYMTRRRGRPDAGGRVRGLRRRRGA